MLKTSLRTRDVPISDPKLIEYSGHTKLNVILVCKYKFVAEQDNELSVSKGDLVKFLEKKPNGWLLVKFMDKVLPPGLIPAAFVEIAVNDVKYPIDMTWLTTEGEIGELESDIMNLLHSPLTSPQFNTGAFDNSPSMMRTSHLANSSPTFQKPATFTEVTRSSSVSSDPTHNAKPVRGLRMPVSVKIPGGSLGDLHTLSSVLHSPNYLHLPHTQYNSVKQSHGMKRVQVPPRSFPPPPPPQHQLPKLFHSPQQKLNQTVYNATPPQPLQNSQQQVPAYQPSSRFRQSPTRYSTTYRVPSVPSSHYSLLSDSRSNSTSSSKENHHTVSRLDSTSSGNSYGLEEPTDVDPLSICIVNCLFLKKKLWYRVDLKYKTFRYHIIKSYQDFYGLHSSLLDLNLKLPRLPEPFALEDKSHGEGDEDFVRLLLKRCQELSFYLTKLSKLHSNLMRQWLQDNTQPSRGLKIPNSESKPYSNDTINQILLPNSVNLIFKKLSIKIILHNNDIISFTYNKNEIDSINSLKNVVRGRVGYKHLLIKMPDSFELIDNIDFSIIKNSDRILLRAV